MAKRGTKFMALAKTSTWSIALRHTVWHSGGKDVEDGGVASQVAAHLLRGCHKEQLPATTTKLWQHSS